MPLFAGVRLDGCVLWGFGEGDGPPVMRTISLAREVMVWGWKVLLLGVSLLEDMLRGVGQLIQFPCPD